MQQQGTIRYLKHDEINRHLWDQCIENASNGLIYAYSWWLDTMTSNWDALVLNDYEAVMPLPWKKKWRIYYLYQPALTAQLGLFARNLNAVTLSQFLESIPVKFKFWEFPLNYRNYFPVKGLTLFERKNYVLRLNNPYTALLNDYRDNAKRNIKKSLESGNELLKSIDIKNILPLSGLSKEDEERFLSLYEIIQKQNRVETYGIRSKNGELIASAVFAFSHGRAYYILVGNHPNGRALGASHALIDGFIREHAGQDLLLDFEGSDVRGLAFFYSGFGAREENYPAIKENRLPKYLRLLKK